MNYLYQQQPKPTNATGVPVTLSVIDANGNAREIGTTTSNADGFYSFSWLPDIEGKYTVYAKFGGTESYYPSQAVTAFTVTQQHQHSHLHNPQLNQWLINTLSQLSQLQYWPSLSALP